MNFLLAILKYRPKLTDYYRNPLLRLRLALLAGILLLAGGTFGYMGIEHMRFLDSLFMTVITLSSVGYGEVQPLDVAGEIFTIVLIMVGLGTAAWLFTTVIETFVSEQTLLLLSKKRMDRMVNSLKNHYIVCGYGRIGQEIAQGYTQNKVPYLVIEQEPGRLAMLREANIPYVDGDAANDDILMQAGIERAAALIAVTPTDAINTFIVLSARGLQPDLYIVARADALKNEAKLLRAGASKVISPHVLGGRWMAITAINPAVTDFIAAVTEADHSEFAVREVLVTEESACAGMTLWGAQLKQKSGALVVAMRPAGEEGNFFPNPPDDRRLAPGDVLIAIGSPQQLTQLSDLLNPAQVSRKSERGLRAV
ncbi:MAG: potassium channel family protein [Janthinobacterium lividum]